MARRSLLHRSDRLQQPDSKLACALFGAILFCLFWYQYQNLSLIVGQTNIEEHLQTPSAVNSSVSTSPSPLLQTSAAANNTSLTPPLFQGSPTFVQSAKAVKQASPTPQNKSAPLESHSETSETANQAHHVPPSLKSLSTETHEPVFYEWKCSNNCSCLPPVRKDARYIHKSYKTQNRTQWPNGWDQMYQSWLDYHSTTDERGRNWTFIFWLDEHNELLANCLGYGELYTNRSFIQQADLSRHMYMQKYGGFYQDMDYVALRDQQTLLDKYHDYDILLQNRRYQTVSVEWCYARKPNLGFWRHCLTRMVPNRKQGCAVNLSGPRMIGRCVKDYFKPKNGMLHTMEPGYTRTQKRENGNISNPHQKDLMIVDYELVAPIVVVDKDSECGVWRRRYKDWSNWHNSSCRQTLLDKGSYAVTIYSHSWGGKGVNC